MSFLFQPRFINWAVLLPIYIGVALSLAFHVFYVAILEKFYAQQRWLFFSFLLDSIFISALIYSSGQNQSLFLFLHLANIILCGVLFQSRGALMVALFTSLSFTLVSLMTPELRGINYVFLLILNNIAFFVVAFLSGFLSDQLYIVGQRLQATGIQLKSLAELNEAIVSGAPLGIVSFDRAGKIFHRNSEVVRLFGFQSNIFSFLGALALPKDQKVVKLQRTLTDSKTQKDRNFQISVRALKDTENSFVALIDDHTELKELENRVQQNEKLAAIGGLAAGIAHEIRNPLAGISGSIQMLSQTTHSDDDKKLMAIVLREIDRLNLLITEFLDYARPDRPPMESVDVNLILHEVLDLASRNKSLPANLKISTQWGEARRVQGNKDKLKQGFLNIVVNAFQAMNESESAQLKIETEIRPEKMVVKISDTGQGMSEETKKRIFEPFFTTKSKGTGLGLAMTYKIFQVHGAEVQVHSEKGKGTTFEIEFPLDEM